jgi:hypothetical protein
MVAPIVPMIAPSASRKTGASSNGITAPNQFM